MVLCLLGVTLISLSGGQAKSDDQSSTMTQIWGVIISIAVSCLYAMANISSRQCKQVHYTVLGFYHSLLGLCTYGVYIVFERLVTGKGFQLYSWQVYSMLVMAGVCDWIAYNSRIIAY